MRGERKMRRWGTILICGGIGSGKSELSRYLVSKGVAVYDSDSRTRALYDNDPGLVERLGESLGASLLGPDGKLDRKALASIIFADDSALRRCEAIVHPAVLEDFRKWKTAMSEAEWCGYAGSSPFVCMESAIALGLPLFRNEFDCSVCVDASLETRIARASARDNADPEAIRARIASQARITGTADFVIENNGTAEELHSSEDEVFRQIGRLLSLN